MLIETNFIITIDELESIVVEYLKKGIQSNENIHKYVQILSITKGFNLYPHVWDKYLTEILSFAFKIYENKLPESENLGDAVNCAMEILVEVHKHTCTSEFELTQNFSRILSCLFNSLSPLVTDTNEEKVAFFRKSVIRPFLFCILNNKIPLSKFLINEVYREFLSDEIVKWGLEDPEFFQALFTKISKEGFAKEKLPWSLFKLIKEKLYNAEDNSLYYFVTKYFFDHFDEKDEVANFVFTIEEYKELVKEFLSNKEELNEAPIEMNSDDEPEYDGFIIV